MNMETISAFLSVLNSLSPLAVIALLVIVILMLVKGRTQAFGISDESGVRNKNLSEQISAISDNHLSELPALVAEVKKMSETLQRMEVTQAENFSYIRSRLNGTIRN